VNKCSLKTAEPHGGAAVKRIFKPNLIDKTAEPHGGAAEL
jgi:hypothetical protein